MSREAVWTTIAVDLSELRENPSDFFDAQDVFTSEVARNPILQPIYKKVATEGFKYSDKTRLEDIKSLVSSFKIFNTEINADDITELPLKEDMLSKIRGIKDYKPQGQGLRSKQYGKAIVSTILAISGGSPPAEISKIIERGAIQYEHELTEKSTGLDGPAQYGGLCADLNRTKFTFLKNKRTYTLDLQGRTAQPLSLEEYRTRFKQFNEQNGLGLSGEQMDYIMHSKDQGSYEGAGSTLLTMQTTPRLLGSMKEKTNTSHLVEIGDDGEVKIKTLREMPLADLTNSSSMEIATIGTIIESDISQLRGERLLVGLSEHETPVKLTFISSYPDPTLLEVAPTIPPPTHQLQ